MATSPYWDTLTGMGQHPPAWGCRERRDAWGEGSGFTSSTRRTSTTRTTPAYLGWCRPYDLVDYSLSPAEENIDLEVSRTGGR